MVAPYGRPVRPPRAKAAAVQLRSAGRWALEEKRARAEAELERELLFRYAARPPGTLEALMEGLRPAWAVAAHDRLIEKGLIGTDALGRVVLTAAGRLVFLGAPDGS